MVSISEIWDKLEHRLPEACHELQRSLHRLLSPEHPRADADHILNMNFQYVLFNCARI